MLLLIVQYVDLMVAMPPQTIFFTVFLLDIFTLVISLLRPSCQILYKVYQIIIFFITVV